MLKMSVWVEKVKAFIAEHKNVSKQTPSDGYEMSVKVDKLYEEGIELPTDETKEGDFVAVAHSMIMIKCDYDITKLLSQRKYDLNCIHDPDSWERNYLLGTKTAPFTRIPKGVDDD